VKVSAVVLLLAAVISLSACQQSVKGRQLDLNYAISTGVGSMTGSAMSLPHGRYTFFSYADPADCLKSVALIDSKGTAVADDASQRAIAANPPSGFTAASTQMIPTMVQQELPAGSYRWRVTSNRSDCAWEVQQILNYIVSDEPPLKAAVPPSPPALNVTLGNSSRDLNFHIDAPGIYKVRWSVTACDRYSGDLVSEHGTEHLGDGAGVPAAPGSYVGPQTSETPMFLGAGDWSARVTTHCFWQIDVTPWRGSLGGGMQGFAG
jgi:hypothetical protein